MRSEHAWALLTARALQYDRVPGGFARLTQADAAALLAGLERRRFLTAMLADVGDSAVHHDLYVHVRDLAIDNAIRGDWKGASPKVLHQIALLSIFELAGRGEPCRPCDGAGAVPIEDGSPTMVACECCRGTGKAPLTGGDRAALLRMPDSTWSRTWGQRYEVVFSELHHWLTDARRHMARKLRKEAREVA